MIYYFVYNCNKTSNQNEFSNYQVAAHINTANETIILNIEKDKANNFKLLIFDRDGNIRKFEDNINKENQIGIYNLSYDTYFIKIYKNSKAVKIFRITKNKLII